MAMKKGQMFLAGAIAILVIIAALMISLKYSGPEYDQSLLEKTEDLDREIEFSSFMGKDSVRLFFDYLQSDLRGFRGFYLLSEKDGSQSVVEIGNFLGSRSRITIQSGQLNQTFILSNNQTAVFNIDSDMVSIDYEVDSILNSEDIEIKNGRIVYADFMIDDRDLVRKKSIYYSNQR